MGVFHVFKIVQMVPNCAKHYILLQGDFTFLLDLNRLDGLFRTVSNI